MSNQYSMTPILSGTRLRINHDTFSTVITSFGMGDTLLGDEIWEATQDGNEVKVGDKWLHVTHKNGVALSNLGWTAIIHKGVPICNNFKILNDNPLPPIVVFPTSFILTDPQSGQQAEYVFVREIE